MGLPYEPSGLSNTAGRNAYSGFTYQDPGSQAYASQNPDRVDAKYFLEPVQSNLLALWQAGGGVAGYQYSNKTWTCPAGLVVGDPIYVSSSGNVALALATTVPKSKVFGFVADKPTSTTCYISHFMQKTGLSALSSGLDVYLTNAGGYSLTPGTVAKIVGRAESATVAWLCAMPIEAVSGWSGFSGFSGNSGFSGAEGISGFSSAVIGPSGESGVSGFSGTYSGASGTSGASGFSGATLLSGYSGASGAANALFNIMAIKTATETKTGTTVTSDTDLVVTLAASSRYKVKIGLTAKSSNSSSSPGWKFKLLYSGTASDSMFSCLTLNQGYVTTGQTGGMTVGGLGTANLVGSVAAGTEWIQYNDPNSSINAYGVCQLYLNGYIQTTTGGTLTLQWCSYNGTNSSLYEGCSFEAQQAGTGAISGFSGSLGASGVSGFSGATLLSGWSGTSGMSSESGVSGVSGDSGASGASAYSGTSGFVGATGGPGASGVSGESGGSGYSGVEGNSGFSGAATSGWTGVSGYSGFDGTIGSQGTSGYSGTSGQAGDSGTSGAVGSQGVSGDSGYSGPSGAIGASGVSGFSGQGDSGWSGPSGQSGESGTSGESGGSGISGFSGESGTSGAQGYSGYSGLTLLSGYSGAVGSGISGTSGAAGTWTGADTITYVLDGGEYPISNGIKGSIMLDYACTLQDWVLIADQEGDLEVDVWRTTYAGYPSNATNSICGSNTPIINNAWKARALNMTSWTTGVASGSILTFYVTSCSAITRATLALKILRT